MLSYFKYKLNRDGFESLYTTFIHPTMEYASIVWAGAHQCDLDLLDKIPIRAMHIDELVINYFINNQLLILVKFIKWHHHQ